MYQLWLNLTPLMDYREHITVCASDFINDAIRVRGDFSDIGLAEFWNYASRAQQRVEHLGFIDDILKGFLGVDLGVLRNEIVDGTQISSNYRQGRSACVISVGEGVMDGCHGDKHRR